MKNDNVRKVFYIKDMEKKEKKIPVSRSKSAFKERERERKEKERAEREKAKAVMEKTWQMKMKHRKMKHRKQRKSHFPEACSGNTGRCSNNRCSRICGYVYEIPEYIPSRYHA